MLSNFGLSPNGIVFTALGTRILSELTFVGGLTKKPAIGLQALIDLSLGGLNLSQATLWIWLPRSPL